MSKAKKSSHVEAVSFDQEGNLVVNKDTTVSKKLIARRAIEAYLERKELEQELESYCFE